MPPSNEGERRGAAGRGTTAAQVTTGRGAGWVVVDITAQGGTGVKCKGDSCLKDGDDLVRGL